MASLAGLQVSPRFRRMIRGEYKPLGIPDRLVGFDFHAALVPYLAMAVRAETRLVATIAALRTVIFRLYRVDGDKAGSMRRGHGFPYSRQAFPQIGVDIPALVAVETERLFMAVGTIAPRLLCQQPVFLHEKGAMIARYAGSPMAVPAFLERGALVSLVVGTGVGQTDDNKETGCRHHHYFKCLFVYHDLPHKI
jgi:hypothetical protein